MVLFMLTSVSASAHTKSQQTTPIAEIHKTAVKHVTVTLPLPGGDLSILPLPIIIGKDPSYPYPTVPSPNPSDPTEPTQPAPNPSPTNPSPAQPAPITPPTSPVAPA